MCYHLRWGKEWVWTQLSLLRERQYALLPQFFIPIRLLFLKHIDLVNVVIDFTYLINNSIGFFSYFP